MYSMFAVTQSFYRKLYKNARVSCIWLTLFPYLNHEFPIYNHVKRSSIHFVASQYKRNRFMSTVVVTITSRTHTNTHTQTHMYVYIESKIIIIIFGNIQYRLWKTGRLNNGDQDARNDGGLNGSNNHLPEALSSRNIPGYVPTQILTLFGCNRRSRFLSSQGNHQHSWR